MRLSIDGRGCQHPKEVCMHRILAHHRNCRHMQRISAAIHKCKLCRPHAAGTKSTSIIFKCSPDVINKTKHSTGISTICWQQTVS